jgi:hypothetical protein
MAYKGQTILKNASRTSLAIEPPAGLATGEPFVAVCYVSKSGVTISSAKGTTLMSTTVLSGVGNVAVFGIEHDGSATYEVTWGGASSECSAATAGFSGDKASFVAGAAASGSSTTAKAPAITAVAGDLLAIAVESNAVAATPPSGMTERLDGTGSEGSIFGFHLATQDGISAGSTGEKTTALASSANWLTLLVGIAAKAESKSAEVSPPAAVAKAVAPAPTVSTTSNVTVEPPAAVAKAVAPAPTVTTSSTSSVTIEPPAAVAKAVAPAPLITTESGEAVAVERHPNYKPPLALDVEVETAYGVKRFAADDARARYRPRGLSFSTQRGDGFTTASWNVSRDIIRDFPDLNLIDTHRFVGHNEEVAYEGFVGSMPRTNDPEQSVNVNLQGWMTYMTKRKMSPLFIDRRASGWSEPTNPRKASLAATWQYGSLNTLPGTEAGLEAVTAQVPFTKPRIEAWFWGGGNLISAVIVKPTLVNFGLPDDLLEWVCASSTDDLGTTVSGSSLKESNGVLKTVEFSEPRAYALFALTWNSSGGGSAGVTYGSRWQNLAVIGSTGLTLHGSTGEEGFYLSDIMRHIVQTYYPKLTWAGEENQTLVTQCTYHDSPKDGYEAIQELNGLALWDLACWEDRKVHYEPADLTKYDWQIRTDDPGVSVQFQGDSIENFANGVQVEYTDILTEKVNTIDPDEYEELRDTSEDNPANVQGINNWTPTSVPWSCTLAEALAFGRAYLAEFNRPKRPGTYTISGGYIKDAAGHWQQGWKVRAGQTVGIMDLLTDEPRLIESTSWDQESLTLTISVDGPSMLLEAVIARHQRALESVGLA